MSMRPKCKSESLTVKNANLESLTLTCEKYKSESLTVNNFKVVQKCNNEFETKIQEALFIKKQNPKLNSQLYASGSLFLLNVF